MRIRDFSFSERGAVFLESLFGLPIILLFLFGSIDIGLLAFKSSSLQFAVDRAARWGTLGNVQSDPDSPGSFLSREDSILLKLEQEAEKLGLDFTNAEVSICPLGSVCPSGTWDAGGPSSTISIQVSLPQSFFLNAAEWTLNGACVVKNEPYR